MVKGILVNVENKTITEVEVGDFQDIQSKIGCRCFSVMNLGGGVDYFYDDEGLLKEAYVDDDGVKHNMVGVQLPNYPQVIMGNGLIMGHTEDGDSADCPVPLSAVESVITFVEYDNAEDRPQPQMGFISF